MIFLALRTQPIGCGVWFGLRPKNIKQSTASLERSVSKITRIVIYAMHIAWLCLLIFRGTDAQALTAVQVGAVTSGNAATRLCVAASATSFTASITVTPTLDDDPGNPGMQDYVQFYFLDGADRILYRDYPSFGSVQTGDWGGATFLDPVGQPFKIVIRDVNSTVAPLPAAGTVYGYSGLDVLVISFNPGLLDPDCPGAPPAPPPVTPSGTANPALNATILQAETRFKTQGSIREPH